MLTASCGKGPSIAHEVTAPSAPPTVDAPASVTISPTARLASIAMQTFVHERPDGKSKKLGYLRLGAIVARSESPVAGNGCDGDWYGVAPRGFVCVATKSKPRSQQEKAARTKEEATLDLAHPIVRALSRPPDLDKPMPYPYAFVRAVAPLYLQLPNAKEQNKSEFKLDKHLAVHAKHRDTWNDVDHGGPNGVPLDAHYAATTPPEAPYPPPPPSTTSEHDLFGGTLPNGNGDATPWWLHLTHIDHESTPRYDRDIANVSPFVAPPYAIFAGRIARHAGVALIGSFVADGEAAPAGEDGRRFAVTADGRLIPTDKLKPEFPSAFHGVVISNGADGSSIKVPFAFIKKPHAHAYDEGEAISSHWEKHGELAYRSVVQLTGKERKYPKRRYLQMSDGRWCDVADIGFIGRLDSTNDDEKDDWPKEFDYKSTKWIDVSIWQQTLVAYEGERPVYATLVSTGIDGMGDPHTTKSTIRGAFKIDSKYVTATMDADDVSNKFELRDVPWVQYFEQGYALHATYWHDDFGKPRSHGCVNLAPIDAHWLFFWTTPTLPEGWHGVNAMPNQGGQEGTWVRIHG